MTTFNVNAPISQASIQAAIDAAMADPGDNHTVVIAAGTANWTSTYTKAITKNLTIQGAGALCATDGGASTTGTDQTILLDRHPVGYESRMAFSISPGKLLRITRIAFTMDASSTVAQGTMSIDGGANALRVDHCHYVPMGNSFFVYAQSNTLTGVIDHNHLDGAVGSHQIGIYLQQNDLGDTAFTQDDDWGTNKFLFLEDNRFRNGYFGDSNGGGTRVAFRYNTMIIESTQYGDYANHGVVPSGARSSRAEEHYHNTITYNAGGFGANHSPWPMNGGTALVWGNTITNYRFVVQLDYTRKDNGTYPYGTPPNGWGNCDGTSGTAWDGSGAPGYYPALDQPGRGGGDLISGSFPNKLNTRTSTIAWPQQLLSPVYVWGNTFTPATGYDPGPVVGATGPAALLQANRDFYQQFGTYGESGTFDGSRGVGQGALSATQLEASYPAASCTPGVAYWSTSDRKLYVVSSPTTGRTYYQAGAQVWLPYYTPYTYPHPLQGGTPSGTALSVR